MSRRSPSRKHKEKHHIERQCVKHIEMRKSMRHSKDMSVSLTQVFFPPEGVVGDETIEKNRDRL